MNAAAPPLAGCKVHCTGLDPRERQTLRQQVLLVGITTHIVSCLSPGNFRSERTPEWNSWMFHRQVEALGGEFQVRIETRAMPSVLIAHSIFAHPGSSAMSEKYKVSRCLHKCGWQAVLCQSRPLPTTACPHTAASALRWCCGAYLTSAAGGGAWRAGRPAVLDRSLL